MPLYDLLRRNMQVKKTSDSFISCKEGTSPAGKRLNNEIIMFPKSAVTIVNASTEVADVPGSSNEPISQHSEPDRQRDYDRQNWAWIYQCDEVISKLPIGLT